MVFGDIEKEPSSIKRLKVSWAGKPENPYPPNVVSTYKNLPAIKFLIVFDEPVLRYENFGG